MDMLLAAQQGVKHALFNYRHLGSIVQDIAAMKAEYRLCKEYLDEFGYRDFHVSPGFNQWLGPFPRDEAEAVAVICVGAMIATYGGACQVVVKTTDEGFNLPRKDVNAYCIKITKFILEVLKNQRFPDCDEVTTESKMIEKQVRSIIDTVLELGDGDLAVGAVKAFKSGLMDVVFPPNITIPGKILPIRDANGAIRFYERGNLPFPKEVLEYDREKLAEREKLEKKKADFDMVIRDVVKGVIWG
jgi:methylaspartate mutase epsilon subunit